MAGGAREPGRSVASKVLAVLGAFGPAHRELTLTEVARRAGLPLSTAHRLVAELEEWQALSRAPDGRLRVGLRLWELGQLAPAPLHDLARPWLQELFASTGENVHLAVRDGLEVLYVDKVYGRRAVPIVSRTGGRLPMHPTGVGRALLAYEPDWFVQSYLARRLERPTRHTITEPGRLARELSAVRAQGYALTYEEMTLGSCSAAAPIVVTGRPVAAVGIVLSSRRARELPRLVEPLLATATGIAAGIARATRPASGSGP
ncbi:helix-turn-helix domain-containing protein [Nonomuraea phyllanthi]|uniref:Helix-turn-helix domain-containing protein n=1 Tax=Nonomuraea phyllanthi TaxID=2219224 RepID=A0A5C4WDH5_9ACTN|nr:IclR family transcriptional regulator [Nonomuraea phyllanthi]KAB8193007.1 helix-turn-helix domain-containing protein [Nonomuraea phyllanthi]QFY11132.1 helix-turn-helix domain-containing protein [Nonomuraea phyllanthi]